ncbi:chaperone protein HtpG [Gammaproteobacteria bacterium]
MYNWTWHWLRVIFKAMTLETKKETLGFQAEVKQLLNLMIHSLYSNKEIFLRELISNAADAVDRLRFEALSNDGLYAGDSDLNILVRFDKEARTITVTDNGIGMNRAEAIDSLGAIARSGTKLFLESLTGDQAKDAKFIGQFGVGFYSSFVVADRVSVESRRAGLPLEQGIRWESTGEGTYTIETIERAARGTEVTLHLREGEDDLLTSWRLRSIITKYSDHIPLPILFREDGKDETVNRASALWTRPKSEIKEEEYQEFYKYVSHDYENPLAWVHSRVEGKYEYSLLLYLPERAPFDLWDRESRHGVKLYVRRVFILDDAKDLLPNYLRFVRGIVDSDDLPLNVSREILQNNRVVDALRNGAVSKVLGLLEDLAKDSPEKYTTFWKECGRALKEGPAEDANHRERIAKLLRFTTTASVGDAQETTLTEYVARMKEGQEKIYYLTSESLLGARSSPHLEVFRRKGVEVLLLSDRVDEWLVAHLYEFDGKSLQSVSHGVLDLGKLSDAEEKKQAEEAAKQHQPLLSRIRHALGDRVKEVSVSQRLTDSPACLVAEEHGVSVHLSRLLKASGQKAPPAELTLEINVEHPLVRTLEGEEHTDRFSDCAHILFDQALLLEGGQIEDPAAYVRRVNTLLQK